MANLNKFLNKRLLLTTSNTIVYTTPITSTTILLSVQVTNITSTQANVTFGMGNTTSNTAVILNFPVPGNDAAIVTNKLVLQPNDYVYASSGSAGSLNLIMSILETLN